ncbi:MAG: gamma-glutamyl-gamma-aminobutyrate hydrolase family protein [Patulibacter sp.]|nr:gamma-glutamyl-gamma-aminobutyrate hydrolase family protein [Patulibacter sp.]
MTDSVLVGITTAELSTPDRTIPAPESEPPQRNMTLGMDYPSSIARAGGVPIVIPPLSPIDGALLDRLDALVVSGGPDIDPGLYDRRPHAHLGPVDPDTDACEVETLRRVDDRGLPILAICRGMQLLNVTRGGTLWQDLPSERPSPIDHRQSVPGTQATHEVTVDRDSLLARVTGVTDAETPTLAVNSFHHQAVMGLGDHLRITARAPDGVVEAIEATDRPFVLGVQWHAESLGADPNHAALFSGLVEAARAERPVRI